MKSEKGWKLMMWLWMVHIECTKSLELKLQKNWNPFVINEFSSLSLINCKRMSIMYSKCIQFFAAQLFSTCYVGGIMIPCQVSTFSKFICSAFQFQGHLAQNKPLNAWKITNEVRKGLKIDDAPMNGAYWTHKKSGVKISYQKWNPFVIDEFSSETLILRSDCPVCTQSASGFCRNPLNFLAHAMWVKLWNHAKF
jgi:hypothetical protein